MLNEELLCCDISFREGAIQLKLYVFGSEDILFVLPRGKAHGDN